MPFSARAAWAPPPMPPQKSRSTPRSARKSARAPCPVPLVSTRSSLAMAPLTTSKRAKAGVCPKCWKTFPFSSHVTATFIVTLLSCRCFCACAQQYRQGRSWTAQARAWTAEPSPSTLTPSWSPWRSAKATFRWALARSLWMVPRLTAIRSAASCWSHSSRSTRRMPSSSSRLSSITPDGRCSCLAPHTRHSQTRRSFLPLPMQTPPDACHSTDRTPYYVHMHTIMP